MTVIITATDFSEIANNAVLYAAGLANAQNAALVVMHAYSITTSFNDIPTPVTPIDTRKSIAESQVETLIKQLNSFYPSLPIKSKVLYGNILDSLDEYSNSQEQLPALVVIGNTKHTEGSFFFNTNLIPLLRNLKIPVLAVPAGVQYNTIEVIGFCYDNIAKGNAMALQQLAEICTVLKSELHVIHANADVANRDNITDFDNSIKEILKRTNAHYHIHYNNKIDEIVKSLIVSYHINWLSLMPRHYSFFESIFHKSHTKHIAAQLEIPLLALHESN